MLRVDTITGHLLLYALALVLPILLMSSLIAGAYLEQEENRIESLAERQARQTVSDVDNRLEAYRATLNVLAVSPNVLEGEIEDVRTRLNQIRLEGGVWFVMRDREGRQLLNTRLPPGQPLPAFKAEGDPEVYAGRMHYADLTWGPVAGAWVTGVEIPIRVPPVTGAIERSIAVIIPVSYLQQLVANAPKGWNVTISDRKGIVMARTNAPQTFVGKPIAPDAMAATRNVPPGQGGIWQNISSLQGVPVVGAYHRMASTGWLIGVSALPEIYQAPRTEIIRLGALLVAVSLLSATLLAFVLGRRIIRAIAVLQVKAGAMRDMRVIDIPRTSLAEVNAVAAIMRETAQALLRREEQQTTLIQELNHRVKNTLTTIQSISRMTMRNSKDMAAFDEAFSSRLFALSATHNLLTERAWEGVELHDLLATELKPFQFDRVSYDGPPVMLTSKAAIGLGMVVHEMGTNAAKYGALQGAEGNIAIRWSVSDGMLTLDWREKTEKTIGPPSRQGFGSRLIQQTIVRELQGRIDAVYHGDGLHAVLAVPLTAEDGPGAR
jgi:two-component sensor histidine kinase